MTGKQLRGDPDLGAGDGGIEVGLSLSRLCVERGVAWRRWLNNHSEFTMKICLR